MRIYKFVFDFNLEQRIQKKAKSMMNKCVSSMIRVQNGLKTPVKRAFYIKTNCVDSIYLFKQKHSIK